MKQKWRASIQALIEAGFRCGAITPSKRQSLHVFLRRNDMHRTEPWPLEEERPQLLSNLITHFLGERGYTTAQLAQLLGLNEDEMLRRFHGDEGTGRLRLL